MGTFKLKEGLFEYSKKRLGATERSDAIRRIQDSVPEMDSTLRQFLNIGEDDREIEIAPADPTDEK